MIARLVGWCDVKVLEFGVRFGRNRVLRWEKDIRKDKEHLKELQNSLSEVEVRLAEVRK